MSVFLRWGIFGILGVAALLYAYNASKRLADRHAAAQPAQAQTEPADADPAPRLSPAEFVGEDKTIPQRCRLELEVAFLAVMAREDGDPLDRLLRGQRIAWQDDWRVRERLTAVATRWFKMEGAVDPVRLHEQALSDCETFTPP